MAFAPGLLYVHEFFDSDIVNVIHSQGRRVFVQVIVDSEVADEYVESIVLDKSDPLNSLTVHLTSTESGRIQIFSAPGMYAGELSPSESAAVSTASIEPGDPPVKRSELDAATSNKSWAEPVDHVQAGPPSSPDSGCRVLVYGTPTGVFVGHDGEIAEYDESAWSFSSPADGLTTTNKEDGVQWIQYASSAPWVWRSDTGGTAIHGNEKHSPSMLTVGGSRSDAHLDILLDGDQDDDVDQFHLHVRRDKSKFYLWDDFEGYRIDNRIWKTSTSGPGSSVAIPSGNYIGGQLRIRSGSSNGRSCDLYLGGRRQLAVSSGFEFETRVKCSDLTNSYTELGLAYWSNDDYVMLSRSASGNWQAIAKDGGTDTTVDTGVSADSNWHTYRIEAVSGQVKFYIDDTLVATITTNIPSNSLEVAFYQETTGGSSNRYTYLDWVEIIGGRA